MLSILVFIWKALLFLFLLAVAAVELDIYLNKKNWFDLFIGLICLFGVLRLIP